MSGMTDDRAPLLPKSIAEREKNELVDPLDLSTGRRVGILAGIWSATFLASLNSASSLLPLVLLLLRRGLHARGWGIQLIKSCSYISRDLDHIYIERVQTGQRGCLARYCVSLSDGCIHATMRVLPCLACSRKADILLEADGRLSNVIGRRGANQLAVGLLMIGTLICGLAKSMNVLIVGRFIAGMGGGGIFTTSSIVTSDMYSIRRRSLTQGIASLFSGVSSCLRRRLWSVLTA